MHKIEKGETSKHKNFLTFDMMEEKPQD